MLTFMSGWSDIGYNFLISADGSVYEGRGWDKVGAQASGWNSQSVGISMMGKFDSTLPTHAALSALDSLIECGVSQVRYLQKKITITQLQY